MHMGDTTEHLNKAGQECGIIASTAEGISSRSQSNSNEQPDQEAIPRPSTGS
jgi:hypothetical protein